MAGFFVGESRPRVVDAVHSYASIRLIHRDAAILDSSIVDPGEKKRSDVLAIRIEDHVAGDTFIALSRGERVADPSFVQSGAADGIQQDLHRIVGQMRSDLVLRGSEPRSGP